MSSTASSDTFYGEVDESGPLVNAPEVDKRPWYRNTFNHFVDFNRALWKTAVTNKRFFIGYKTSSDAEKEGLRRTDFRVYYRLTVSISDSDKLADQLDDSASLYIVYRCGDGAFAHYPICAIQRNDKRLFYVDFGAEPSTETNAMFSSVSKLLLFYSQTGFVNSTTTNLAEVFQSTM
ncbi:hypothetical protein M3Y95_00751700 [Aphelenchoides besseyi]|nr:hypothetical protein M3Y95_00751700 [Aphelenchoides besseyi]